MELKNILQDCLNEITCITSQISVEGQVNDARTWTSRVSTVIVKMLGEKEAEEYTTRLSQLPYDCTTGWVPQTGEEQKKHISNIFGLARKIISEVVQHYDLIIRIANETNKLNMPSIIKLENICNKFHSVAKQLQSRHNNRSALDINDEYDVQYILHALLKLHFDDIRPEEYSPSYASASSRVDFLLKKEKIVIEVKKTRNSLKRKEIYDQLIIDIDRYKVHPDCKLIVCFIYDPEAIITNPLGLIDDLEKNNNVKVIINPK